MIVANGGSDKRWKASMVDPRFVGVDNPIDCVIDAYAEMLEPIKDRLLCILDGNHSLSVLDKYGTNPTKRVAYKLWGAKEAPNRLMGYSGFYVTKFTRDKGATFQLVWNLTHGISNGTGKTLGGFITSMGTDSSAYVADIHCFAHNHRLAGVDRVKICVDRNGKKIISRKEVILNSGTFLKAFSDTTDVSYAEKARYHPGELGYMELNVKPPTCHKGYQMPEIYHVKRSLL